ncbi:uncharacterized protein LOC113003423 [Solenopsis invicta]|uniref:uncharacterized protein LOC113003423 n=1 Tax=Solenopsis invicta TaxID=13686 RepID=UPI00193D24B1|nr:uncharacterized protein LOC113003423 [Solenopsis invicta]
MSIPTNTKKEGTSGASTGARLGREGLGGAKSSSSPDLLSQDVSPAEGRDATRHIRGPSTGAGGLELFSPSGSLGSPKKKEIRKLQITLEDFMLKGGKASSAGSRPGPACSKGNKPSKCGPDATGIKPGSALGPLGPESRTWTLTLMGKKRAHNKTSTTRYYITSSSSESDEGPPKKGRGRPAKDPSHEGQFTAQALAKKAEAEKAKKLIRDHKAILNPEVEPSSERAARAKNDALERAEELEAQPMAAVAAVMTESLGMMAKSVERSNNIQGPIRKDLWRAYTDLTAGLTAIMSRNGEDNEARQRREESAALAKARAKWTAEKRKLEAELGQLRVRVALLERKPPTGTDVEGQTDVETQTDLDEDVSRALVGSLPPCTSGPTVGLDMGVEEPPASEPPQTVGGTTMRPKTGPRVVSVKTLKEPLVITARDLKGPYYRPPLQGVSKQLNPLSKAANRVAAPVSRSSFPALPPPSSSLETSGWARVGEGGRKEKKRAKALTEDGLREVLSRVLPAVLAEMGLLPPNKAVERPKTAQSGGKMATQTRTVPQNRAGKAATSMAAKPVPAKETTSPSILELWTEVVSKKSRRKAAKVVEEAAKTALPAKRPIRVLPIPSSNPPTQQSSSSSKKKKKRGGRGGGQGGPGGPPPPRGASSQGPARVTKIKPPTTAAVTVTCADPRAYAQVLKTARERVDLSSLGIEDLRPRRAVTGALILEVRGAENGTKADALAEGIREALGERDDVKVARPCGGLGHLAKACTAKAGCPVCRDAGKPAEHRIGAKGCLANKPQRAPLSTEDRREAGPSTISNSTPPPALVPMVVVEEEAPLPQRERTIRTGNAETRETEMEVEEPQGTIENAP